MNAQFSSELVRRLLGGHLVGVTKSLSIVEFLYLRRQQVWSVKPTTDYLRGFEQLEDHHQRHLRQAALRMACARESVFVTLVRLPLLLRCQYRIHSLRHDVALSLRNATSFCMPPNLWPVSSQISFVLDLLRNHSA